MMRGGPPMGRGGRGGGGGNFNRGNFHNRPGPQGYPQPMFDQLMSETGFQRVTTAVDDKELNDCLLARNTALTPSAQEQSGLLNLVTKVNSVLENLILNHKNFDAAQIEEVKQVGSFKKGTILAGHNHADVAIILKTLPTREAVNALANKTLVDYRAANPGEWVTAVAAQFGFEISSRQATVKCLITTVPLNVPRLEEDVHIPADVVKKHLAAVKHTKWFEENASHSSIKALVRLLRDIRQRFIGFSGLTPWMCDVMAHYTITQTPDKETLPLPQAFRRVLQLLSGGLFLPGSAGLQDPVMPPHVRIHEELSYDEMDAICYTSQTLLRVASHAGFRHILGLEGNANIATEMSVWGSIVVTASEAAYDRAEQERLQREDEAELPEEKKPKQAVLAS